MALTFPTNMLANKPYVYLDESGTPLKIEVYVKGPQTGAAYALQASGAPQNSNTYLLTLTLTTVTTGSQVVKTIIDCSTLNGFSSTNFSKIVVRVVYQNNMVGRTTIIIGAYDFDAVDYKLFSYLQFIRTGTLKYHGLLELGPDELSQVNISQPSNPVGNQSDFIMRLNVNVVQANIYTNAVTPHFTYEIGSADGYDPTTYETLELRVDGSNPKKTKGSTTDSEADASGDD